MDNGYDILVVITPNDYKRVEGLLPRTVAQLPGRDIIFIGSSALGEILPQEIAGRTVRFLNEDDVIPFSQVHEVMREAIGIEELPRGVTGWYYQQFLKMQYARICQDEYYMTWDGDTIPCQKFSMFQEGSGAPYLDVKDEYCERYFITLGKLFPGMGKLIRPSFISEHMLFNKEIMEQMLAEIEANEALLGNVFWEKVIHAISAEDLRKNSFSEFETYGTYVAFRHTGKYKLREWHSFRLAGQFFEPDKICDRDFAWLAKDFDAVSFEKRHTVREDHRNLFDNPYYQERLSARQMLEIAQEEFKEGYIETWGLFES